MHIKSNFQICKLSLEMHELKHFTWNILTTQKTGDVRLGKELTFH